MSKELRYGLCPHKKIAIKGLHFHCDECVRGEVLKEVYRLLQIYTVKAPEESYAATFTPEQFMKILTTNPI